MNDLKKTRLRLVKTGSLLSDTTVWDDYSIGKEEDPVFVARFLSLSSSFLPFPFVVSSLKANLGMLLSFTSGFALSPLVLLWFF